MVMSAYLNGAISFIPDIPKIRSAKNRANTITEMANAAIQRPFCTRYLKLLLVTAKRQKGRFTQSIFITQTNIYQTVTKLSRWMRKLNKITSPLV